ncbi:lipid A export permease/ATP-binding protein MsbA [Leptothrix ochracea]|uniref:lipid A export permease/ATP-binding protein MsbA n=1 Tax=Leptothrix ochracea TaxID=735331 RepID=UPI0034E2F7CD
MTHPATASRLLRYIKPYKWGGLLGVLFFFLSAAVEPAVPALFKQLLDTGFKGKLPYPLWMVPVVVISLFAVRGLLAFLGTYLLNWSTSQAVMAIRIDLIGAILRADASLYTRLSPGVAASKVINDPQSAASSLSSAVTTLLRDGTTLVALMGYLFYVNWQLTLLSLITLPLLAVVVRLVHKRVNAVGTLWYESQVRLVGIVDDVTRAWRVVRTFDAADFEKQRFQHEAEQLHRLTLKNVAASSTMTPLTQIIASAGVALILTLALVESAQQGTSVGDFVAFLTALLMTISPMRHLTDISQPILNGLIVAKASFELMDTPPEPDQGTKDLPGFTGQIHFDQVAIQYEGTDKPALQGLNLDIPAGKTIALVGPSGAGKTTIISTVLGFVAPTSGTVRLDGVDLTEVRKADLRRQFAVVSQDIVLFEGSIAANVAYAQPIDPARIEECLRSANLWDFVASLPESIHTSVGTNGSRLSGGQRQRLAIARALYKDAPVWLFDEATSALDTESERTVQQSIEQWHGKKTLILIAHRLSTVRNADRIVVMLDGRVAESGSHNELIAHNGLYTNMVRAQAMH